jgi:hypothetical protein
MNPANTVNTMNTMPDTTANLLMIFQLTICLRQLSSVYIVFPFKSLLFQVDCSILKIGSTPSILKWSGSVDRDQVKLRKSPPDCISLTFEENWVLADILQLIPFIFNEVLGLLKQANYRTTLKSSKKLSKPQSCNNFFI